MLNYGLGLFVLENILIIKPLVDLDALQPSLAHSLMSELTIPYAT